MDEKMTSQTLQWYAMRSLRRSVWKCKEILEELQIEHFIPMTKVKSRTATGRFKWDEQPLAFNYVFIRATTSTICFLKQTRLPNLCYLMHMGAQGADQKVTIPDEQMQNFIAIAGTDHERILYLPPSEVDLSHGDRVRIIGGIFNGVEGVYQRVKGTHSKQVVVCIEGIVAVATTTVPACLVKKIIDK